MPAGRERAGLRLAVSNHAEDFEVRIVEGGAIGVDQRVPQLASFVDRSGRLRRVVARDAARERELAEEVLQADRVSADRGIDLAVGALKIRVRDHPGPAVPGPADEDRVEIPRFDHAVQMRVEEIQTGRRSPVAQQPRFDVFDLQWFA